MIRIITTKRLRHLERTQRKYQNIICRLSECCRWFSFYTPLNGIFGYLDSGFHQIENVRREFRVFASKFDWTKSDGGI